ncbi:hypothetical protein ACLKMH_17485 [Psychromonas sp. KJ10-10]|uniref:hypothetical protein n=1 Tax=Psychromonas sp. KJ10-10 TaxID=3391823 RepID=UPI0039B6432C
MNMVMNQTTVENKTFELHYGLVNKQLKHISEVESGLGCNCYCPHCSSQLIAKKGILEHIILLTMKPLIASMAQKPRFTY